MAKQKLKPTDGLGPLEIKKTRAAVRLVWHRSHARALCVKRCTGTDGFYFCEECKLTTPKIKIDHIEAVGDLDDGYIKRMFVESAGLRGLCSECHRVKTAIERKRSKTK